LSVYAQTGGNLSGMRTATAAPAPPERSLSGNGSIRPLAISKQLASKTQFSGLGRLRTYLNFMHSAFL
jgi:hypothetical protein